MEIVLRVKRTPSEPPIDYISITKKPKNFETYFSFLSLSPKLILKRAIHDDPQKFNPDLYKPSLPCSTSIQRQKDRQKLLNHFRNTPISQSSLIYYNGTPLKPSPITPNSIIDEYYLCEDTENAEATHNLLIDLDNSSESSQDDSQDSNCENHPWNDYPDESSEECSDSSVEYDDEVNSDYEY